MTYFVETMIDDEHAVPTVTSNRKGALGDNPYQIAKSDPTKWVRARIVSDDNDDVSHRDACRAAMEIRDAGKDNGGPRPLVRVRDINGRVSYISQRLRFRKD